MPSLDDNTEVRLLPMQQTDAMMIAFAVVVAMNDSEEFRARFGERSLVFLERLIELAEEGSNALS